MTPRPARTLHRGHFAFMRALAQGLDERSSWNRYLHLEGEHADRRTVRRTIDWIRDEFAAAARRERRPGTARLILLDADSIDPSPSLPALADFAATQGLEEFSEAEQIEAYEAAFPHAARRRLQGRVLPTGSSRRARVIERQLEALRWLEDLLAQDPKPDDRVVAWLNPLLSSRLERAGITTLQQLLDRINGVGARWWLHVPGVGPLKAARILDWLRANQDVLQMRVGPHVATPRTRLAAPTLAPDVASKTGLVPLEKRVVPPALDGSAGENRAPKRWCQLAADCDRDAIGAWLAAKATAGQEGITATQRSYRREGERLLLWSVLVRKWPISSFTAEDAQAYVCFLASPPADWCGPRHHQRWSPLWRPLEGPLSPAALRQALVIVRGLHAFLVARGYLNSNPFAAVTLPSARPVGQPAVTS